MKRRLRPGAAARCTTNAWWIERAPGPFRLSRLVMAAEVVGPAAPVLGELRDYPGNTEGSGFARAKPGLQDGDLEVAEAGRIGEDLDPRDLSAREGEPQHPVEPPARCHDQADRAVDHRGLHGG